jgi:hypothetical protein
MERNQLIATSSMVDMTKNHFLLMAPQHVATVKAAFEQYRRRVFPFTQREERFRDSIGPPPPVIHVDSKVNANLSFIDLFSSTESWKKSDNSTSAEAESHTDSSVSPELHQEHQSAAPNMTDDSTSNDSNDNNRSESNAKMPPTSLESLQEQYRPRSTESTTASTASSVTDSKSMLSTSSARFLEFFEKRITRQQKDFDRKDKISSERLLHIETSTKRPISNYERSDPISS